MRRNLLRPDLKLERRVPRTCAWALGILLLAGPVLAQPPVAREPIRVETDAVPIEAAGLDIQDGAILLGLDEAVELALRQNLGLAVQRYNRTQARLAILQNLGIYDLLASATLAAEDVTNPTITALQASEFNNQSANFRLVQAFPTGGDLVLDWTNSRQESNSPFVQVNPGFRSGLDFSFTQPLLRDFGRLPRERGLLIAQNRSQASREELERQVSLTIQDVINGYWSLVGARQQLEVARESLALARELHDRNRIQVEVGTLAPLELVQSEAAIAEREEGIITAQAQVQDAEDRLRLLLNLPEGELWGTEIRPATDPLIQPVEIDVEEAIRTALAERPELLTQQLDIERARIESAFFRNQTKPTLDLSVGYGFAGIGGDILQERPDGTIGVIPGGYGDALDQVTGFDFDGWNASLTFAVPLQNRAARAQRAIADLLLQQSQTVMEELRRSIVTEVRTAARRVETAAKQIDAARASRVFQERNLEAERKRYENGMSTSFQITQIQEDLTQARSREVNAIVNYRTALADYYRSIGLLLEEENVDLVEQDTRVDRWQFSLGGR